MQSAYQILVASSLDNLKKNKADMWDTGKVNSRSSANTRYNGKKLSPNKNYFWKVRIWNKDDIAGTYSEPQQFTTGDFSSQYVTSRYQPVKNEIKPVKIVQKNTGHFFIDFGKAAFGTIKLNLTNSSEDRELEIHLGEKATAQNTVVAPGLHTGTPRREDRPGSPAPPV